MKQATISVQDLSGAWAQIGTGQLRGIQPSDVELTSGHLGREGRDVHADARAVRPVAGHSGVRASRDRRWRRRGVAWPHRGRTDELALALHRRPLRGQAEPPRRRPVRARVRPYRHHPVAGRARSLDADLTLWRAAGLVTSGDGVISLSWPVGTQWDATVSVGVILDLGPSAVGAAKAELTFRRPRGQPSMVVLAMRSAESVDRLRGTGTFTDGFTPVALSSTTTTAQTVEATPQPDRPLRLRAAALRHDVHPDAGGRDRHRRDPGVHRHGLRQWRRQRASRRPGREGRAQHRHGPALRRPVADRPTGSSFYIPEFAPSGPRTLAGHRGRQRVLRLAHEGRRAGTASCSRTARARPRRCVWGRWGSSSFEDASSASGDEVSTRPS